MKSYDYDLRVKVTAYYKRSQMSLRDVGEIFGVSKSSIWRWLRNLETKKRPMKDHKEIEKFIMERLKGSWLGRLRDLIDEIKGNLGMDISISKCWRILRSLGYSYKKSRKKVDKNTNSKEVKDKFKKDIKSCGYEKILCFDEVGFQMGMNPRYGWSPKGKRCEYKVNKGGRKNYSGMFLISTNGIEKWEIKNGSVKKDDLIKFFDEFDNKGKMVMVLDNLRAHHNKDLKEKLRDKGLDGRWLPPYSPELNPIEEVFSNIKRSLRYKRVDNEKGLREEISKKVEEMNKRGLECYYKHSYD